MTDSNSVKNSVARRTCGPHAKKGATKFLYISRTYEFSWVIRLLWSGWLELKNQLIELGGVGYLSILILGGVEYGAGYHPLAALRPTG